MSEPVLAPKLLAMRGITKRFPGVVALADVSLTLAPGEVLALMGENGAGKSTLMKILGGALPPDSGELSIAGARLVLRNVRDAKRQGIALIHQELMLAHNLDIASNIFLGNESRDESLWRPLRRKEQHAQATELLERVGLHLSPATAVGKLTAGQMQMVEIAKALSHKARILIMDEPTSSLTNAESLHLFAIIGKLRAQGMGIIYISHRMEEVLRLADRITVLRDGCCVGDLLREDATQDKVVSMMVGRELTQYFPARAKAPSSTPSLVVRDLRVPGAPAGVSFEVRAGEILGFAGLVGSGRTELMETLFGVRPSQGGEMWLQGQRYQPSTPRQAIDRGVYLAPEDRKRHGLVLPMTVAENTSLPNVSSYAKWGFLSRATEREVAAREVTRLRTKTPSIDQKVVNLSGGNQQKIVLAKWLAMEPRVLLLDEPTRGVDVGAKSEIYRHMALLADSGMAIVMVSSDMEEVLGMSDRVVVMHERRINGVLEKPDLSPQRMATLMTAPSEKAVA